MKAKEKAKELVLKFAFKGAQHEGEAKKFALIAVDEIIELAYWEYMESMGEKEKEYWEEVKQEIINL
jgi:hypothetical protein